MMRTARSLTVSRHILCTSPASMHNPCNHTCPPHNHICPPQPHMPPTTTYAHHNHACPPIIMHAPHNHKCPLQPCMPPPCNHTCPHNNICPPQPCMPPTTTNAPHNHTHPPATMHTPCNHACPQPCTPPGPHTPSLAMHAPPPVDRSTDACENITKDKGNHQVDLSHCK